MKIDKEYATQLMDEVKWLSNHGIKYTFVKVTEEKITIYNTRKRQSYLIVWRFFIVKNREENIE